MAAVMNPRDPSVRRERRLPPHGHDGQPGLIIWPLYGPFPIIAQAMTAAHASEPKEKDATTSPRRNGRTSPDGPEATYVSLSSLNAGPFYLGAF